ncbi:MAG: helix-turn-helix domain-containing protein [Steroidobacteraceae bacterium]
MEYVARTPRQLGQILRACRKNRRLTQGTVGSRVGVRQSQISSIETRGADITVSTLYRLLAALDLELVLRDRHARNKRPVEW